MPDIEPALRSGIPTMNNSTPAQKSDRSRGRCAITRYPWRPERLGLLRRRQPEAFEASRCLRFTWPWASRATDGEPSAEFVHHRLAGAAVCLDDGLGVLAFPGTALGVAQQVREDAGHVVDTGDGVEAAGGFEPGADLLDIESGRTHEHREAVYRRLDGIVAAGAVEAAADEGDIRERVGGGPRCP